MQLIQCENGHFYDQTVHNTCPYCNGENSNVNVTHFVDDFKGSVETEFTQPIINGGGETPFNPVDDNAGRTVVKIKKETGIDPIVGWLVCIEGSEKGKDYRVHAENNFIGRDAKMDICIRGDDTISRENHAIISFDIKNLIFYFSPGSGRSIVRVNNVATFQTVEIKAYDVIEIGSTKLMFVPFCGEGFSWTE